jgi:hypothetical protein
VGLMPARRMADWREPQGIRPLPVQSKWLKAANRAKPNQMSSTKFREERRKVEIGLGTDSDGSAGRYFCPCRLGRVLGKGGQCANKLR